MSEGNQAAGFPCPLCGGELADIVRIALPQLELRCKSCETEFAVEA